MVSGAISVQPPGIRRGNICFQPQRYARGNFLCHLHILTIFDRSKAGLLKAAVVATPAMVLHSLCFRAGSHEGCVSQSASGIVISPSPPGAID